MAVQLLPRGQWRGQSAALPAGDGTGEEVAEVRECVPTGSVVAVMERKDREYVASFAVSLYTLAEHTYMNNQMYSPVVSI